MLPDVAGTYLVRVEGHRDGASGDATAIIDAFAYGLGLQAVLTWDIDMSDVDLHLVNLTEGGAFYQTLTETDIIWEVADVDTSAGTLTPIDLVYFDTSFGFAPASKH